MLSAVSRRSSCSTSALASMTSITFFAYSTDEIGARSEALHRLPRADALHDLLETRSIRDARQLAQDQLRHRGALARGADLQRLVQLFGHVADLDHFHVVNM